MEESCSETESEDEDAREPQPKRQPHGKWRKRIDFKKNLRPDDSDPIPLDHPEIEGASEFDMWQKFVPVSLFEEIARQTNLYATRDRNRRNFSVAPGDLARFFGVLLLSGYHRLPQETDYWSNQPDLGVPIVSDAMSRNSFQAIKSVIHFADNQNLPCGNKVAKVEPLYASLNEQLVQYGVFDNLLSIDESMVPYYGRHSVKMYIKGKPIRFGFKIWSLCGSNGYPYHLKIYQGKEKGRSQSPLGTRVVNSMVNIVERHSEA